MLVLFLFKKSNRRFRFPTAPTTLYNQLPEVLIVFLKQDGPLSRSNTLRNFPRWKFGEPTQAS